jgi:Holliday junction resolvase YEN1
MGQAEAVFFHLGHATAGQNPELRMLFFKLAKLLNTCILPIFVFDGPLRPAVKHGLNVVPITHWLTNDFKELIDAFGFYLHEVLVRIGEII